MLKKVLLFIPFYLAWVMGAVYLAFGVCTACQEGPLMILAILIYLVVILIPIWLFIRFLNAPPSWAAKVEADGVAARATILSVKDTGMVINNTISVIKLQLRIEPPNAAPFEVSQEKEISLLTGLGGYAAGANVKVKYDPANPKHVVILSDPVTPPPAGASSAHAQHSHAAESDPSDLTQQLAELSKLHKSGELSDAEYAAAKKKLLG